MFKRSLASLAAVAVASGAVVASANAVTVNVNNDNMTCTIKLTNEEASLTSLTSPLTLQKGRGAHLKASIVDGQLLTLRAGIEKDEMELAKLGLNAAEREKLMSELKKKKEKLTAYQNLSNALEACDAGKNYNSNQPSGPNEPGPNVPGPNVPGPNEPEGERALPSTNGAVIGAIVAVLGILAAVLPIIKSILRALLP